MAFSDLRVQHGATQKSWEIETEIPKCCEVSFPIRSCILVGKDAMVTEGIQGAISGPSKLPGNTGLW